MIRRYKKFLFLMIIGMFLFGKNVYAEEDLSCNSTNLGKLRTMAANVKVSYIPNEIIVEGEGAGETGVSTERKKVLDIKIYNITSTLYIKVKSSGDKVSADEHIITLENVGPDGSATIRQPALSEPITYEFTIYSDSYGCSTKVLRTFRITLPKFNFYSELDICQDIPEYYLCQPYTTFTVDGETFYEKVDEYKAKLANQVGDSEGVSSENNGIVSEAVSKIFDYKYIIVGIIVAIGVVTTILILRKRRSV